MKKRISKSANMYVMFGLLALLFISLGYLSMQSGREGLTNGMEEEEERMEGFEVGDEEDKEGFEAGDEEERMEGFEAGDEEEKEGFY